LHFGKFGKFGQIASRSSRTSRVAIPPPLFFFLVVRGRVETTDSDVQHPAACLAAQVALGSEVARIGPAHEQAAVGEGLVHPLLDSPTDSPDASANWTAALCETSGSR